MATVVLAIATAPMLLVLSAGRSRFHHSRSQLCAIRLAEDMIEELLSRPYFGASGGSRSGWHLDDYDGFSDGPDLIQDFSGADYPAEYAGFTRTVEVTSGDTGLTGLGSAPIAGKAVVVTVLAPDDSAWTLARFIPEPHSP